MSDYLSVPAAAAEARGMSRTQAVPPTIGGFDGLAVNADVPDHINRGVVANVVIRAVPELLGVALAFFIVYCIHRLFD